MPGRRGNPLPARRAKQRDHLIRKRAAETGRAAQTPPPITGLGTLQMPLIVLMEFDFSSRGHFNPLFNSLVCFMLGHAKTPNQIYAQSSNNRPAS